MAALHSATVREMKAFNCCKDKPDDSEKTVRKKKPTYGKLRRRAAGKRETTGTEKRFRQNTRFRRNQKKSPKKKTITGGRSNAAMSRKTKRCGKRNTEKEGASKKEKWKRKPTGGNHNRKRHVLRLTAKRAVKGLMAATEPPPLFILAFLKGCCLGRSDNVLARTGIIGRTDFHGHF